MTDILLRPQGESIRLLSAENRTQERLLGKSILIELNSTTNSGSNQKLHLNMVTQI